MSFAPSSLRAKFLVAVIACAVVPLAAVGAWITVSVSRAGERFIEAQLDSTASRAQHAATTRWSLRQADVALLAENEPVRKALGTDSSRTAEASRYLQRAFESMPGIAFVMVSDARRRVRWTLGVPPDEPRSPALAEPRQNLVIERAVTGDNGDTVGTIEAHVRLAGLLTSPSGPTDAGSGFVALHSRTNGAWLLPSAFPSALLDASRFEWSGHRWTAVKKTLADPPVDLFAAAPADGFTGALARTAGLGALALVIVALAVLMLSVVITKRLTGSLSRLAEAADAVSRGNLDARIDANGSDEVGRVARTFNEMTASVRSMMRERSQREAVSAMGELAATLAHQVRSPATAIRLDLERARMKLAPEATERALLSRALEQLDRLERTVSGSLRMARSGAVALRHLDAREPLTRAIAGVVAEASARGVTVASDGVWETLTVKGDAPSLEQLFTNLLANAIQAARSPGSVTIGVNAVEASVSVHDDGADVSPETLRRAGEPFFSTKPEGTGLGLAIARRIAAAHGATLDLRNDGGGTTAEVRFRA